MELTNILGPAGGGGLKHAKINLYYIMGAVNKA